MKTIEMKIPLGSPVKDVVSGFEGIVSAYTVHLTGCDVIGIKSRELDKDGKVRDPLWVDVTRVEVLGPPPPEIQKVIDASKGVESKPSDRGGPQDVCPEQIDH